MEQYKLGIKDKCSLVRAVSTRFARLATSRFGLTQRLSFNKQSLLNGIDTTAQTAS
jgi:hypothetical protein